MKLHTFLIAGLAFFTTACVDGDPAAPEQGNAMQDDVTVEDPAPESENAWPASDAFIEHMHAHAARLDDLNFALADDNLERAMTPAYWLSRHDELSGIPEEWRPYVTGMREAASAVEAAPDLAAARVAAQQISEQCQACHDAAGIGSET